MLLSICAIITMFFVGCGNNKKSEMSEYLTGFLGDYGLTEFDVTKIDEFGTLEFICEEYESLDNRTKRDLIKELRWDDTAQELTDSENVDVKIYIDENTYYYYKGYYYQSTEQHGLFKVKGSKSECVFEDNGF